VAEHTHGHPDTLALLQGSSKLLIIKDVIHWPQACTYPSQQRSSGRLAMNSSDVAAPKSFLVWMALWIGALLALLPALAGS
jgi:hypothetical protein